VRPPGRLLRQGGTNHDHNDHDHNDHEHHNDHHPANHDDD
jgi:hypothetical protein